MNHVATNIQVCRVLYGQVVSSLGHKYLGRRTAASHSGALSEKLQQNGFLQCLHPFSIIWTTDEGANRSMCSPTLTDACLTSAILLRIKWCLIVALVCMMW